MKVYYWPDGTWCYAEDLAYYSHLSDDHKSIFLHMDEEEIEMVVQSLI